jgi:hypothetical protein
VNELPAWLKEIFDVRRSIGDPVTADFVFVKKLPKTALQYSAHTTGNGAYKFYNGVEWREYSLKFSDAYIRVLAGKHGKAKAAVKLMDNLIAQIDPADYLTSGNSGGQSMSFPSLSDVLAYYNALRDALLEEEAAAAGMNSGRMLQTRKKYVGGVREGGDGEF